MKRRKKNKIELPSLFWRDVVGFEGHYQVSVDGEMKSLDRWVNDKRGVKRFLKGRILKPMKDKHGYLLVHLSKDGKHKSYLVHRLVAEAFIPNPNNRPEVNHKDENPLNNRVENLEWCNTKYNNNYGTRNKRIAEALSNSVYQYTLNGEFIREWSSTMEIKRQLGYNNTHISACCRGKRKTYKGFIWRYHESLNLESRTERRINGKLSKPVVALDKQGRIVHVFPSTAEAERNGYNSSAVCNCCRGYKGRKTHKGLVWYYQDDYLKKVS